MFRARDKPAEEIRVRGEAIRSPTEAERIATILADLVAMRHACQIIVGRGKDTFLDTDDPTQRLAAKMLVIDVASACDRLPPSFKESITAVPWHLVRATRNNVAHNYVDTDYEIVWNAIVRDLPKIVDSLTGHSDSWSAKWWTLQGEAVSIRIQGGSHAERDADRAAGVAEVDATDDGDAERAEPLQKHRV